MTLCENCKKQIISLKPKKQTQEETVKKPRGRPPKADKLDRKEARRGYNRAYYQRRKEKMKAHVTAQE